jgi:hypothetical protein
MTDLDRALHDTLTRVADGDVQVERLLAGARATGVRYRRRRVGIAAVVATSVGTAALVLAMTALRPHDTRPPATPPSPAAPASTPAPSTSPPSTAIPALPLVAGAPTADADPNAVGQPLLGHLSLTRAPFPLDLINYQQTVAQRDEILSVSGSKQAVSVRLGADPKSWQPLNGERRTVQVAGRTGTLSVLNGQQGLTLYVLRWQTANGLWLQVADAPDEPTTLAVAESVRLDRTYRCTVPYRLGAVPAAMKVDSCTVAFNGSDVIGMMSIGDGRSHILVLADRGTVKEPNETLGGRPARVRENTNGGGAKIMDVMIGQDGALLHLSASGPYDAATVRRIAAESVRVGGDDPSTWPADPLRG